MAIAYVKNVLFGTFEDYKVIIAGSPLVLQFTVKGCFTQDSVEFKIWLFFERKISCAVGKCGHCKTSETYVCLEGPIFNYENAKKMIDLSFCRRLTEALNVKKIVNRHRGQSLVYFPKRHRLLIEL